MKKAIFIISFVLALASQSVLGQNVTIQNISKSQRATIKIDFTKKVKSDKETNVFFFKDGMLKKNEEGDGELVSKRIKVPIKNPEPFLSLAAVWEAKNYVDENISIQYRASVDGKNWNKWEILKEDEHSGSKDDYAISDRYVSSLIFLDKHLEYLQYRIIFQKGGNTILTSLRFDLFSPGDPNDTETGQKKSNFLQDLPQSSSMACPCPSLTYTTRTGWGCPDGQNSRWTPQVTTVTHLVVHHAAGYGSPPYASQVAAIWNQHAITQGWGDIGYNWVIDPNGVLYQGRAWSGSNDNTIGAHMCACNSNKMGVCLLGDFTSSTPTAAAYNTLKQLLAWKACSFNINPTGSSSTIVKACCPNTNCSCSSSTINNIIGHRDGCANCTACPGNAFYPQMATLRTDVQTYINSCGSGCTQPSNDGCSGSFAATPLTFGSPSSCNPISSTSCGATSSGFSSCVGTQDDDVFFSFIPTSTTATIRVVSSAGYDAVFQVLTGPCGGSMSQLACIDSTSSGGTEHTAVSGLTTGATYFIRVWHYGSGYGTTGNFSICVRGGPLPIQLASFSGRRLRTNQVQLDWRTISEVNNYGFYVQRRPQSDSSWYELPNGFIPGHGTTNEPHDYSFTDITAPSGALQYRLKQIDLDGTENLTEPIQISAATTVNQSDAAPKEFSLKQNYPNPFNPTTTIEFSLPKPSEVTLKVFDMLGREVATLANEHLNAGTFKTEWDTKNMPSGTYFYRIQAGDFVATKKLILMK